MKKIIGIGVLSIAAMTMLIGVFAGQKNEFKEAKGYSTSSLPTTIDLNDTSASNIRSYYSSLNNLSTSERQGTNLLKNLKTILKNGQKYYDYDDSNVIWQIYEITDRDWSKSPASSTTYGTYNSSTKKITNYTYGTNSNYKNNPYIHALYINRDVTNETKAWGNHNQDEWGINREHVWPKAEGFDGNGSGGARGDPMHLMAGNGYSNNIHSNYYYGYVKTSSSYTNCGSKYSNQNGNLKGTSKTLNNGTVFEPQDCDKGDIARAIFYMVARYNYLSGSDSDGIDSNNPNLTLTQNMSDWSSSSYTSTTSNPGKMGILTDLLAWHHADPVDEYEIHRNNLLYTNYTNNRNPFIDFPEWVDYIWGTATYSGTTYQSYNNTPTGYAKPTSDQINGYNSSGSTPTVNSVTLSRSSLNLDLNGTKTSTLSATVSVSNNAAQTVNWSSSNTSIATVSSGGLVTAKTVGTATITATSTVDNTKYDTCTVHVVDSSQQSSETEATAEGSETAASGAFDGWTASGTGSAYADGAIKFDSTGDNIYKIDIFTGEVSTKMTSLSVTINGKINGDPTSANSYKVEALNSSSTSLGNSTKTGASVYTNSDYSDVTFTISSGLTGCTGIRITYATKGAGNWAVKSASWTVRYMTSAEVTSISASVNKSFFVGDTITKSDITLKNNLNVTITDFEFDNYQFTYEDAPDGGDSEDYYFNIPYNDMTAALVIPVSRKAYSLETTTKIFNATSFSTLETSYTENQTITVDGTGFAINGYYYLTNSGYSNISISSSKTSAPGFIKNTTKFSTGITNVEVLYTGPDIQLSEDGSTWVDLSSATVNSKNYYYFKVLCKNTTQSNYVNIYKITVTLKGEETAKNVANYIMYEDTEGQCTSKFDVALEYFKAMPKAQRTTFMTSDDYVISTARERFVAWALNQGKTINYTGGDYVISSNNISPVLNESNQSSIIVIVCISALSLLAIGMFLLKYKKKEG